MFKIKLSTVLSIVSFVGVAVTGYLAARGGKKAAEIENELEEYSLDEATTGRKLKATWKCYIPAIAAGIVTIGCGAYAKRLDTKEIVKLTGAVGVLTNRLQKVTGDFGAYRQAVINEIGSEKEAEIRKGITDQMVKDAETGMEEGIYTFHIDWLGDDLYFDAKNSDVIIALDHLNKTLNDDKEILWPQPSVAQFFDDVKHSELITPEAHKAGWNVDELSAECGVNWINWKILPKIDHTGKMYYDIWLDWYPWEDIMGVIQKLEDEGII